LTAPVRDEPCALCGARGQHHPLCAISRNQLKDATGTIATYVKSLMPSITQAGKGWLRLGEAVVEEASRTWLERRRKSRDAMGRRT
jgi:hypothetical protein